ncbi:hypothetical protein MKX01_015083 [Papaver californicum]|nr:hypothetical protein MKX01_015083 [Papaver californicum]
MSSRSSSLVLASAVTIFFFTFLTLSLFCAQPVDGEGILKHKKTVTVKNDIGDPKIALKIHCWSSDDDFGEHTLYHKQIFYWRFNVNLWYTTKFVCDSSWYEYDSGKHYNAVHFTAYSANRDWKYYCKNDCVWSIREDGGYYGDASASSEFPSKNMFSYE